MDDPQGTVAVVTARPLFARHTSCPSELDCK